MPKSSLYLQRSLVLDNGHLLVQVPKRNGILWKRIAHKEFGITSRKRCGWNSQKADVQFSVQQLHCPGVSSKAKDTVNCLYILLRIKKQLRLFRIIVFANQLSLYGAVANTWRIWIPSRSIRATWCTDGTINCPQWNQGRSSFGEWHPITPESSIATIWRTNWNAFTRKQSL